MLSNFFKYNFFFISEKDKLLTIVPNYQAIHFHKGLFLEFWVQHKYKCSIIFFIDVLVSLYKMKGKVYQFK